jgi:hypothetical protein
LRKPAPPSDDTVAHTRPTPDRFTPYYNIFILILQVFYPDKADRAKNPYN